MSENLVVLQKLHFLRNYYTSIVENNILFMLLVLSWLFTKLLGWSLLIPWEYVKGSVCVEKKIPGPLFILFQSLFFTLSYFSETCLNQMFWECSLLIELWRAVFLINMSEVEGKGIFSSYYMLMLLNVIYDLCYESGLDYSLIELEFIYSLGNT